MRNRLVRLGVVVVLLAAAAAAAYIVRGTFTEGASASADLDRRIDRLLELTSALRGVQATYVVSGQDPTAPLARFPDLLQDLTKLTAETGALVHSPEAISQFRAFADATSRLAEADAAAREQLLVGDVLTASHHIFGDGAQAADVMTTAAVRMRDAERSGRAAAAETMMRKNTTLVASVVGLWVLGVVLLALMPVRQGKKVAPRDKAEAEPTPAISIGAAADLCTELSRVETTTALNALLTRTLALLEAEGAIVWMEAGGELLAAAAAGYAPEVISRLSSIRRHDDNMTATAWRDGVTEVIDGGEQSGAAIAVPLFSGQTCCGVFALELRTGRPADDLTRDVARMIAAQLATVVVGPANTVSQSAATGS